MKTNDVALLRELARRYAAIAALPIQDEKRRLWTDHFSLKPTRIPILATYGMWNVWCREVFGESRLQCHDPYYRQIERDLRMRIFQHEVVGDDSIQEPWLSLRAAVVSPQPGPWGLPETLRRPNVEGGAAAFDPPLKDWADGRKLQVTHHAVDEAATTQKLERLSEVIDGILPIDVSRTPVYSGFHADISTSLAKFRGLETLMLDMYEYPAELHGLLAFMRDGILENNLEAESAGHFSLTSGQNQACCYADCLEPPRPNSGPRARKALWGFCAAQEFALISPEFHEEFMFRYQQPIYAHFGLVHYGCCEDLTRKIPLLRKLDNLRSIAVGPTADVRRCAEQIGADYVIAWRPNPTDMVCCGYDEARVNRVIREGLAACRGGFPHIHLKDIETVEGDVTRLTRWVRLVRHLTEA